MMMMMMMMMIALLFSDESVGNSNQKCDKF